MRRSGGAIVASALLPPLGLHIAGAPERDVWIAAALTVLGFLPGVAFALHSLLIRQTPPIRA